MYLKRVGNVDTRICARNKSNVEPPDRRTRNTKPSPEHHSTLLNILKNPALQSAIPEPAVIGAQTKFIKLNVGGMSYRLKEKSLKAKSDMGFLHRFARMTQEERIWVADGFMEDTGEYFFERSPQLFDVIYQLYITGNLHKPMITCLNCTKPLLNCMQTFEDELSFWDVNDKLIEECCGPSVNTPPIITETINDKDEFRDIRCGFVRRHIWNLIEVPESSAAARVFSFISILAVLASNFALVLGSLKECQVNMTKTIVTDYNETKEIYYMEQHHVFDYIEYICISWFSVEYFGKMMATPNKKSEFLKILNLIDLVAIVPFYIELCLYAVGLDPAALQDLKGALLVVRILRVLRVIRLFKLGRYSTGLQAFAKTLQKSKEQLGMLVVVLFTGVMFFSTIVYYLEKDEKDTFFTSIPAAFWWCIVTMTTVGYGDMYPITIGGKLVASCAISCGVLVLALPITIVVDNFMHIQAEESTTQSTVN